MTNPAPADDITLPALPELSYLGDDHSYGYEACDMAEYARDAVKLNCASPSRAAVPACLNAWFLSLPEGRQAVLRDDKWMLAHSAFDAGLAAASGSATVPAAVAVGAAQAETAQAAPVVPPGYALVPLEPTVVMREAGHWAWMKATNEALEATPGRQVDGPRSNFAAAYRAMLAAAAPSPCTCPSGDGSLRWPCAAHPPATPGATHGN